MTWFSQLIREGSGIWWAICQKKDKHFIGACGLNNILKEHQRGEIGFWLLPEYWGNGYMKEALPEVVNYGRESIGLHRIEALVESPNFRSKKLLTEIGFESEGKLRDYEIKNGKFISLEVLSLLS